VKKPMPSYTEQNKAAAAVILADPEQHGGPGSLAVQWARLVVERQTPPEFAGNIHGGEQEHAGNL
jgi:hypothetical protein